MATTDLTVTTVTQNVVFVPLEKTHDNADQAGLLDQDKVQEIAESLKHNRDNGLKGLLQVPVARVIAGDYELAFGRHRRAAFILLAETDPFWSEMPLIVREMDDLAMFEALADENFKRRDLNFVEAGEIIRAYVTKYNKTYVEAAAFFGKTEEYIRSTARFTSLPEKAKEMGRAGKMNVTTARLVLSAQKVLGKDDLEDVIEDLDMGIHESPSQCVESAIERSAQRFTTTDSPWWNEPKTPIKFLRPVQRKEVAALLDVDEKQDQARKSMLNQVMTLIASGMEIPSEQFDGFRFEQLDDVRILVNPPACTNCERFAQVDGAKFCGLKACFERKALAWKRAAIEKVSNSVGIPLYVNTSADGPFVKLSRYQGADQKLFEARHEDLRLMPVKGNNRIYNNFEGLPGDIALVAIGKTAEKRIKKEAERSGGTTKNQIMRAIRNVKDQFLVRFIYEVVSPAFIPLFEGWNNLPFAVYFFREVIDSLGYSGLPQGVDDFDEQITRIEGMRKKSDSIREIQRLCAYRIVDWRVRDYANRYVDAKKPLIEMAKFCQQIADEWGVKLPKNMMEKAEEFQAEFSKQAKAIEKGEEVKE